MAEIKSTLDLVMERTKNLTLTSTEKQAQKDKENKNRIKGLVQKLLDGLLTKNQIIKEYDRLKKEADLSDDKLLADEVLTRLDPGPDTQILLEILEECCGLEATSLQTIIDDHRHTYNKAAHKRKEQLKEILARQHAISGSAVLPNLEADEEWQRHVREMRNGLEDSLSQAIV